MSDKPKKNCIIFHAREGKFGLINSLAPHPSPPPPPPSPHPSPSHPPIQGSIRLAELQQASADHFGADPETVLWGEAAWLADATAKLKDIADQHFRCGEYSA